MTIGEHVTKLQGGVKAWNAWRELNSDIQPDLFKANLSGANLFQANLSGANLSEANLREANLSGAHLSKADLSRAHLSRADLSEANLSEANLSGANLSEANLSEANLSGAHLSKADLSKADLSRADLSRADLSRADLRWAHLSWAHLSRANLSWADLSGADLSWANLSWANLIEAHLSRAHLGGANLTEADLTKTVWFSAFLSNRTQLNLIKFSAEHDVMRDGSNNIILSQRDQYINWSRLRAIGRFPLFGVSWSTLIVTLLTINTIDLLNETKWVKIFKYLIPIPERTWWILFSSILLVIGSTLYRLSCPQRVQEFSETEWVEKYGHPRLLYWCESLSKPIIQWPTLLFTVIGGSIAIWLVIDRLYAIVMRHADSFFALFM